MRKTLDQTIAAMLTENTGRHFLDSGGAYGRNWEKNQGKDLEYFQSQPSATLEIYTWERDGKTHYDLSPTINVFHFLHHALELDDLCREFNDMEVGNWNGEFCGTDQGQCDWLTENGFEAEGDAYNNYNWNTNLSQVLQFQHLTRDGDDYVLLQVHGGCDVRGGYTDAKLFRLSHGIEALLSEDCGFSVETPDGEYLSISCYGTEFIDDNGSPADDEYLERFASCAKERYIPGDFYAYY